MEEINNIIDNLKKQTNKVLDFFLIELKTIRTRRVSPDILNGVKILYYNILTPINQLANIITSDSNMLIVQPYDKTIIKNIEKAIFEANLGFNPNNDGKIIRIPISKLTEDRRKELVKKAKKISENFKIQLRNIRREFNDKIKKIEQNNISKDTIINLQNEVQKIINDKIKIIEEILIKKEILIMEI